METRRWMEVRASVNVSKMYLATDTNLTTARVSCWGLQETTTCPSRNSPHFPHLGLEQAGKQKTNMGPTPIDARLKEGGHRPALWTEWVPSQMHMLKPKPLM